MNPSVEDLEQELERRLNSGLLGARPAVLDGPLTLEATPFVETVEPGDIGFYFARYEAVPANGWVWLPDSDPIMFFPGRNPPIPPLSQIMPERPRRLL